MLGLQRAIESCSIRIRAYTGALRKLWEDKWEEAIMLHMEMEWLIYNNHFQLNHQCRCYNEE